MLRGLDFLLFDIQDIGARVTISGLFGIPTLYTTDHVENPAILLIMKSLDWDESIQMAMEYVDIESQ